MLSKESSRKHLVWFLDELNILFHYGISLKWSNCPLQKIHHFQFLIHGPGDGSLKRKI